MQWTYTSCVPCRFFGAQKDADDTKGIARTALQICAAEIVLPGDLGEAAFVYKAMSLGLVVAKPYGNTHRYDFIVEGGSGLWRVQGETCICFRGGFYKVRICCRKDGVEIPYNASEIDFVAAYIRPEQAWYVVPVREVVARMGLGFRPKGFRGLDIYAQYREAWHLL